jgi:sulfatase maturation enzyme AslB (radical SAM superfamily)
LAIHILLVYSKLIFRSALIDFAVNKNQLVKVFDICFFGGKPLLKFDTLKEIVENIELKYK